MLLYKLKKTIIKCIKEEYAVKTKLYWHDMYIDSSFKSMYIYIDTMS